ncbi:class F sortase [Kitasatospora sp. NPDC088346]|uniref:class F sortase n=1 Tax=Kitasatospora sp. NPDC088346 TaxID=3364073 RepID=UPI0038282742
MLVIAGVGTAVLGRDPGTAPVRIAPVAVAPAGPTVPDVPSAGPATASASPPVRLVIPGIGVDAPVEDVGLNADGTVEVPPLDRPAEVGWYRNGPAPGLRGPAVLLGHYDTRRGPAVFHRLPDLRAGDRIEVRRADGTTTAFQVRELRQFAKDAFPTELVYGDTAGPQLRLITCGGTLAGNGHYTDNIVVLADPVP